jgi:hypothetical protein
MTTVLAFRAVWRGLTDLVTVLMETMTEESGLDFGIMGNALTAVVACGGAGALIDFWIGKAGQLRVRSWLETRYRKRSC